MLDALNQKQVLLLISIALVAATFVAYEPIRRNGFISYDDDVYITSNPNVSGGITRDSVIWAFTTGHTGYWHPLTWVSIIIDCSIFGPNPAGHHLVSVGFHIANAILLFWILVNMTGSTLRQSSVQASSPQAGAIWPSAFVAAVFALHPLGVESVAWASERKTVLSGLFWMLTMLAYIRYAQRPGFKRYVLVLLAFAMGLMAKPMVVTLPFVLLLLDYWPLNRLNSKFSILNSVFEKVPLFVLSAMSSVVTFVTSQHEGAVAALWRIPLNYRIANTFICYITYISKMIWPSRLAIFYPPPLANLSVATAVVCALLFFLITAICLYVGLRRRYAAVGWLWFVGTLVPVIGLVQVGSQAMADRYMYTPMLGLLFIIAWFVKDLITNRPRWKVITAVSALAVLSTLLILTRMQVGYWRNSLTLYGHALKVTENNDFAEGSYALALVDEGRLDEAESHLRKAVQINPNPMFFDDRLNLAFVLLKQGKVNEAIECLNEVIKLKPDSAKAAKAHYFLATAYGMDKKYDDAIKAITSTLTLDPNYPDARKTMGALLLAAGKLNEAIPYLNEVLQSDANQVEIYENLGLAYHQLGKFKQAIQVWTKVIELKPDNASVLNNLAWLWAAADDASIQDVTRAVEYAQRACKLTGYKEAAFLDTLAVAYAAAGRFKDAIATAEQAVNIAKAQNREILVVEIQDRLDLYRAGRPYRQK